MPDRWTVCEHILAEYEGQIPTQGCLSPAARQKPFSMRCSACRRCMENVSPSSNSKWPGISTRQDGGSRRLPRLSGWLDKVRIATQARGDSIERGPVEHPEKCSAVGQGIANSTSGPPVALRSARIYRGRLLDQQVIPTLGYSAPAT